MIKSVFAKYITAFMLIIAVSFIILAAIISSMISSYNMDNTLNLLERAANNIRLYVEEQYEYVDHDEYVDMICEDENAIMRDISILAQLSSDSIIFLTDRSGNILMSNEMTTGIRMEGSVPGDSLDILLTEGVLNEKDTLGDLLPAKCIISAVPVYVEDGQQLGGSVFVCTSVEGTDELVEVMIKTMIMAMLWVLLAALIAVYFITEKIIGPLKDMGTAAKSFAAGQFDVRVPVVGKDEVSELAVAFNNMASSLANQEDLRRSFLSNVAHDLRTPMTVIRGFIEGILDGKIPPEKHNHYLKTILNEAERLTRLVNTLLDITRIQAGEQKFNMQPFDVCEMARQILFSFEQKIENKRLDVEFECDRDNMYVMADYDSIHRILQNLCDNGVKFARENGKYRIGIHQLNDKIHVSVFDEGDGIPAEDLPYVFDRFYKVDKSRGMDKMGTGLGLYISRTIIEAHNERIWVESEFGKNCCFTFTLKPTNEVPVKKDTME